MKRRMIPVVLAVLMLTGCASVKGAGYTEISMDDAVKRMSSGEYIIVDVRRPDEFAEGHIPGAVNVPNKDIGSEDIPQLPDKSAKLLVYCRSGRRSKEAAEKLAANGYKHVYEFGGILDWQGEIEK